jgi:hypothetical protein
MIWNADNTKRHRSGTSVVEVSAVAVRVLAPSSLYAMGCPRGSDGCPAIEPVAFAEQDTR